MSDVLVSSEQRLLGPTLWVSGALLWGYVVLGELVVNVGFEEGLAVPALFVVLIWNWLVVSRPLRDGDRAGRAALVAGGGIALFLACLLLATTMFGSSQRSHFEGVTVLLCVMGVAGYAAGRRMTALPSPARGANGSALIGWFAWIVVGLFTVVAMISAMARA